MKDLNMNQITEYLKKVKRPGKQVIRKIIVAAVILAGIGGVGAFAAEKIEGIQEQKLYEATYNMVNAKSAESGTTLITKEEAAQIAMNETGIEDSAVKFLEVQLEQENNFDYEDGHDDDDDRYENVKTYNISTQAGNSLADNTTLQNKTHYIYEVSFIYNGLEYSFDVDGIEKKVLNSNIESILD